MKGPSYTVDFGNKRVKVYGPGDEYEFSSTPGVFAKGLGNNLESWYGSEFSGMSHGLFYDSDYEQRDRWKYFIPVENLLNAETIVEEKDVKKCPDCDQTWDSPGLVQIGPDIRGVKSCENLFHSRQSEKGVKWLEEKILNFSRGSASIQKLAQALAPYLHPQKTFDEMLSELTPPEKIWEHVKNFPTIVRTQICWNMFERNENHLFPIGPSFDLLRKQKPKITAAEAARRYAEEHKDLEVEG